MRGDRTFRRWCAWLTMTALCLAVVSPIVSRTLSAAGMSMAPSQAMDGHASGHPPQPHRHGDPLDKCGYCNLLASQPLLPSVSPPMALLPPLPMPVAEAPPRRRPTTDRPPITSPRGPPAHVHT